MTTEREERDLEQLYMICKDMNESNFDDLLKYIVIVQKQAKENVLYEFENMINNYWNNDFYTAKNLHDYLLNKLNELKSK